MAINRAATTEDVYYLYERNKTVYDNCKFNGKQCPSEIYGVYCDCQRENEPVLPITIGDQCVPCDIKRKVYIKPGEECAICLENIIKKSEAYLTSCGHSFHKLCAFKVFETKSQNKHTFSCPICRARLGYPEFYCRYTCVFKKANHEANQEETDKLFYLDLLEEFWLSKDFITPQMCRNGHNHALGMKNGCSICLKYRETGN